MFWKTKRQKEIEKLEQRKIDSDKYKRGLWASNRELRWDDGTGHKFNDGKVRYLLDGAPVTEELTEAQSERLFRAMQTMHAATIYF